MENYRAETGSSASKYSPSTPSQRNVNIVAINMATELAFTFLANRAIRDESSRKWTFIDMFESFLIPKGLSSIVVQSFVVGGRLIAVEKGELNAKIEFVESVTGRVLPEHVELKGHVREGNIILVANFGQVKFEKPGKYAFRVTVNGKVLENKNLFFNVLKEEDLESNRNDINI